MVRPVRITACLLCLLLAAGCASRGGVSSSAPRGFESRAAELNFRLGVGYMEQGYFGVALEKLQKSLRYDDEQPQTYNALGVLYEETREPSLAQENYRHALVLEPGYALAGLNLGRLLCDQGQAEEGERRFLDALASDRLEDRAGAYLGAGVCARNAGAPARAEAHLRKVLEQQSEHPRALYELARVSVDQDKFLQARAFLQRYHAAVGYSAASLALGITIEDALGDAQARRAYTELLFTRFATSKEAQRLLQSE